MFGHQDNSQPMNDIKPAEPVPDATLSADANNVTSTPAPLIMPSPSSAPAPSAPVIDDAAASDYIMTNAPHADGEYYLVPAVLGE